MTVFEFCSFNDHIVSSNKPELGQHVSVVWMQTWILTRTWACLCAFEQMGRKKNRLDRDNLETETPLAQVLWVTSWFQPAENQWGLGRPPVCFQGNRALSPPPPHKTSHSLSLCLCPCLSLSLSHTRSHVLSWRCWGGGRWWGDSL